MKGIVDLKRQLFPRGIRRSTKNIKNKLFARTTGEDLYKDLVRIGIKRGDLICFHSKLSTLGYLVGGIDVLLKTFRDVLGKNGTLVVPTFSGGGSTFSYIQSHPPPFDPQRAISTTGVFSEYFRKQPDVLRSLHPTHSVSALGPLAKEIIKDHVLSTTPFGQNTPYDRFVGLGGKILLLGVNANSVLHYVEEKVDWPNLWHDEYFQLPVISAKGEIFVKTKVHRGGPFSYILLPGKVSGKIHMIHHPNHALPFCLSPKNDKIYEQLRPDCYSALENRRSEFIKREIVRFGTVGQAPVALINSTSFCERIAIDLEDHFKSNEELYKPEVIKRIWSENQDK